MSNSKTDRIGRLLRITARSFLILAALAVLIGVIGWMEGFFADKIEPGVVAAEERSAESIPTAKAELLTATQTADAVGTVQPRQKTEIAARLLSTIQEIRVEPGESVEKGDVLVTLDDREIQAQLREIEAARLGVESDFAVRKRELQRYKLMLADKAVSQEDFDRIEGMYHVTEAQLKRTEEQIARMRIMLSYTEITAPRDGIIAARFADPGDLAAPGRPLLTLHNPNELELHANVREGLAGRVRPGQTLQVHIDARDLHVQGTVREIVPQAEAASRSVLVKVSLPVNTDAGLYIGMFGRLEIPTGTTQRIVVPANAVQQIGQLEVVDVVQDGKLKRRFVRTGKQIEDMVEILAGLEPGEIIAVSTQGKPS